jgi:hypothetical protein
MLRNSERFGKVNRKRDESGEIRRDVTYCCDMPLITNIESIAVHASAVVIHVDADMRYRRSDDTLRTLMFSGPAARQLHAKLGALLSDPDQRPALETIGALRFVWLDGDAHGGAI